MGGFADLGAWEDIAGLELPLRGRFGAKKLYRIPPVDAELGPKLQRLMSSGVTMAMAATARIAGGDHADQAAGEGDESLGVAALDTELLGDAEELSLFQRVLGSVYDEMTADGVPWPALKHAAMTAIVDATYGRELAERYWKTAVAPGKLPGRAPATSSKKVKGRKGTGRGTSTVSTAGTTPSPAPATGPAGRTSSNAGC